MKLSLALGGGGSRGIAHLGVLRALEREGFKIGAVAGTSAGGIVAALYAAGYSVEELILRCRQLDFSRMYRYRPGDRPAILGSEGIFKVVVEMLGERTFSDLAIPAALTSVDLRTGREIVLKEGNVAEAVLATTALPGIFPPVELEGYFLVDGGLMDPVPVIPVRELAVHLPVVAVVLNTRTPQPVDTLQPPRILGNLPFLETIARLRLAQAFNIFVHSIELGSSYTTELKLQMDRPDLEIRPNLSDIGLFEIVDVDTIVRRGELAAQDALPALRHYFSWRQRLKRMRVSRR